MKIGHKFTSEQIEFLAANIKGRSRRDVTEMFNRHFRLNLQLQQIVDVLKYRKLCNGLRGVYLAHRKERNGYYTQEQIEFLKESVKDRSRRDLMVMFNEHFGLNLSYKQINNAIDRRMLRSGGKRSRYSKEHIDYLTSNIKDHSYRELRDMFNNHFNLDLNQMQINHILERNKLRNGLRGINSPNQFKKGCNKSSGWGGKCIGSERTKTEKSGEYIIVKVAEPNIWRKKHTVIWEDAHGPVPKNHVVIFGDGNRRNFNPDNLLLVSRRQLILLNRNRLISSNIESTKIGIAIADIRLKINDLKSYHQIDEAEQV